MMRWRKWPWKTQPSWTVRFKEPSQDTVTKIEAEDATLESAQDMPLISGNEGNSNFVTLSIESLLAQGIPMEVLMGALDGQ
jgi:hypothetical protein